MEKAKAICLNAVDVLEKQTKGQIAELEKRIEALRAILPEYEKLREYYKKPQGEIFKYGAKQYVMIENPTGHCEGCDFFQKDTFNVQRCTRPQSFPSCCINIFKKGKNDSEFYHFCKIK